MRGESATGRKTSLTGDEMERREVGSEWLVVVGDTAGIDDHAAGVEIGEGGAEREVRGGPLVDADDSGKLASSSGLVSGDGGEDDMPQVWWKGVVTGTG